MFSVETFDERYPYRASLRLWRWYYAACEAHDATICTYINQFGSAQPTCPAERAECARFAHEARRRLFEAAHRVGVEIPMATWDRARHDALSEDD